MNHVLTCSEKLENHPRLTPLISAIKRQHSQSLTVKSENDAKFHTDKRVLGHMFEQEAQYVPHCDYFTMLPTVKPWMRSRIVSWMADVCEEQQCEDAVFPLSVNYLDRVLASISRDPLAYLQSIGAASMLVASKLRDTVTLSAPTLVAYTDYAIPLPALLSWELTVLYTLKWDTAAITPPDFIAHILVRLDLQRETKEQVILLTNKLFVKALLCEHVIRMPPSVLALGALDAVLPMVLSSDVYTRVLQELTQVISKNTNYIFHCGTQLQKVVGETISSVLGCVGSDSPPPRQSTPVDVQLIDTD